MDSDSFFGGVVNLYIACAHVFDVYVYMHACIINSTCTNECVRVDTYMYAHIYTHTYMQRIHTLISELEGQGYDSKEILGELYICTCMCMLCMCVCVC
jgi:hypothetical protein